MAEDSGRKPQGPITKTQGPRSRPHETAFQLRCLKAALLSVRSTRNSTSTPPTVLVSSLSHCRCMPLSYNAVRKDEYLRIVLRET
jgi:hypothetical protein